MLPAPLTSGVSVAWRTRCSVPLAPPWSVQAIRPNDPDVRSKGATWLEVHVLPWSDDLATNRPVMGLGVMLAVPDCQYTYTLPLLSVVIVGPPLPKLAAWLGWAARDPAAGVVVVVVVAPGTVVVGATAEMALVRRASSAHAESLTTTGGPKLRPPLVDVATATLPGLALGAVTPGVLNE